MLRHPVLDQLVAAGIRLGTAQVRTFLTAQGEPHRAYPVVHVAGTNGKGSTCLYVTRALEAAGYRVGLTLSPHLEQVNERIHIDGEPIDDASLNEAIEAHQRRREDFARSRGLDYLPLTYFEFLITLAFQVFAERGVNVAVVETGMGGGEDATNVVTPQICAITTVGMDHADRLGDTIEQIAHAKAGIIKPGVPVVLGPLPPAAREIMEQRAASLGCVLIRPGQGLMKERHRDGSWSLSSPAGTVSRVRLAMSGEHQSNNALVAVGVLHGLRGQGFHIPDEAIKQGLETAQMPARIERLRPALIVDGAHNLESSEALAAWLATQPRPESRLLLFGMGLARDPVEILTPLLPHVDEVVLTRCAHPQARDPSALGAALEQVDAVLSNGGKIEECLAEVYAEAHETVVAGSLYLAGAVRSLVRDGVLDGIEPGQGPPEE